MAKKPVTKIFIPFNVPSLKNGKKIITVGPRCPKCRRGKFPQLIPNDRVKAWRTDTAYYWKKFTATFRKMISKLEPPYRIEFTFVRKSKHLFDYTNALDTVQDEMVAHDWITDDNSDVLLPVLAPYKYDKENPGVFIKVLK